MKLRWPVLVSLKRKMDRGLVMVIIMHSYRIYRLLLNELEDYRRP